MAPPQKNDDTNGDGGDRLELGSFEGDSVRGVMLKVSGSAADRALEVLGLGDEAVIVVTGACSKVEFETKDEVLHRVQTLKASDMFVVTDALDGADLIQRLRLERKKSLDALLGTPPLPGVDEPDDWEDPPRAPDDPQ